MPSIEIRIRGARQHNLKGIDVCIPRDRLTVITGVSGSGKSSLAFDTLFAEGQRRYVETLSTHARQLLGRLDRPEVESIEGLSPPIAIDQQPLPRHPRSTVGTATEIHDLLRLLFAKVGEPHCPICGASMRATTIQQMKERLLALEGQRIHVYAPVVVGQRGHHRGLIQGLVRAGYIRARIDGELRELADEILLSREEAHTIEVLVDRLEVQPERAARLVESLETACRLARGVVKVEPMGQEAVWFTEKPRCLRCAIELPAATPRLFSFNDPQGACAQCKGLGVERVFDPERIVPDPRLSLKEGAIAVLAAGGEGALAREINELVAAWGLPLDVPFAGLPKELCRVILYGGEVSEPTKTGKGRGCNTRPFIGVIPWMEQLYENSKDPATRQSLERFRVERACQGCQGSRLSAAARAFRVGRFGLDELCRVPLKDLERLLEGVHLSGVQEKVGSEILGEVRGRLRALCSLGLGYLSLDRASDTLSAGEAQRVRLATQMGSTLVGVLYILDEPSIGLHPADQAQLMETLVGLRDAGNTVVVVEHDPDTILRADWVVDMGPGAGNQGGELIYSGHPQGLLSCQRSITGAYLSGRRSIPLPSRRRPHGGPAIEIMGASAHNLKDIDARFPLGCLTCVTGVSGSGKSTLVVDTLHRAVRRALYRSHEIPGTFREIRGLERIEAVVDVDQSPIGRTPRSNPATFMGLFRSIREIFAQLPEARVRGYGPERFSFNLKGGRCEECQGEGIRSIEMVFLPNVYATCEACGGNRFNQETLEIKYKGFDISQVLGLTVNEALRLFENIPRMAAILGTLKEVGLGYLKLGQPAPSLSGGEAQRLKLARELCRPQCGKTLYILDEPTTGLHFEDVRCLLEVIERLVEAGNTVVVIEHNLEVIKCADYIIDLGPGAGEMGGEVVATGTPEEVALNPASLTGTFLRRVLNPNGQ